MNKKHTHMLRGSEGDVTNPNKTDRILSSVTLLNANQYQIGEAIKFFLLRLSICRFITYFNADIAGQSMTSDTFVHLACKISNTIDQYTKSIVCAARKKKHTVYTLGFSYRRNTNFK